MLSIDAKEKKLLTFQVEIDGVGCDDLVGFVRFMHENIEYGFPVDISSDTITAIITPLSEIFPNLKSGTLIDMRLDMNTEDRIFTPWKDEIEITMPVTIEAKLTDENDQKLINEDKKSGIKVKSVSESNKEIREKKEQMIEAKVNKYKNIKPIREKKKPTIEDLKKHVNEEFIYKYMEKVGTKNKQIQEIIYEQATAAAGSGESYAIFKQVVKALGKKRPK
jgi:hypothetical protein